MAVSINLSELIGKELHLCERVPKLTTIKFPPLFKPNTQNCTQNFVSQVLYVSKC